MKTKILFGLFLFCCTLTKGQTNYLKLETKLKTIIDTTWTFEFDTSETAKDIPGMGVIKSGDFIGTIELSSQDKDHFKLVVCRSIYENALKSEIGDYYKLASCVVVSTDITQIDTFFLFLPWYPCYDTYSEKSKILIAKINIYKE
jgi:hypothetical protein